MKNVIGYKRVSTDGQTKEDKFGLEVQESIIREYCARNDLNIVRWFVDEGESGAKERPGFDEIVYGDVQNPPFEAVVVAKSDRVARDINIYYYYKMMLRKKDIELISVAEDFGQFGVFANMLEAFTLCVAEMERDNITKRTSSGRRAKADKGGYSGGRVPYGYRVENKSMIIVPEAAEAVREIFRMKDEEGCTLQQISDAMNAAGYVTKNGNKFFTSTIQCILGNRKVYEGFYKYGKNAEWVKGQHEPILVDDSQQS